MLTILGRFLCRGTELHVEPVRQWVKDRCGFECTNLKLDFYPGRYAKDKYSIIPVGDVVRIFKTLFRPITIP